MKLFQFPRVLRIGLVLIGIPLLHPGALAQRPGTLDTNFNFEAFTSGQVNDLAITASGQIYAGGSFTRSENRRTLIRLTAAGEFDPAFNAGITGTVDRIALDNSSQLLAAGLFSDVNGSTQDRFVRFNPDGTHDPRSFEPTFAPTAMVALPDNGVLLGGSFSNPIRRLARLNPGLGDDGSFYTDSPNSLVEGFLLQPDGKVIVFGWFWMFGATPAGGVLRLNADMSLDTTFNASVDQGIVRCAVLQANGRIVIGGSFFSIGGVSRSRIARLNSDGTLDTNFSAEVSPTLNAMAIDSDQRIYIAGSFSSVNGSPRERFARLHPDGDLDTGFDPGTGPSGAGGANAIAIDPDGKIVIGGAFTNYNGVPRFRIARVLGGPSIPEAPLITSQPAETNALAGSRPQLIVRATGGPRLYYQWQFNGAPLLGETRGILTLTNVMPEDAGQYSVIVSNELGVVQSDVVSVGVISIAPAFLAQPTNVVRFVGQNVQLVTVVTGAPPPVLRWYQNGNLLSGQPLATLSLTNVGLSDAGEYLLIASNFLGSVTSATVNVSIALATNAGAVDITFRPEQLPLGTATNVTAAALQPDGKVLIARNSAVYRLRDDGSIDPGFTNLVADDRIEALAVQPDGKILVGGAFRSLYGVGMGIARLQTNGMLDSSFAPSYGLRRVQGIAVQPDGDILLASASPANSSGAFPVLSRLLANGSSDFTFNTIWGMVSLAFASPQTNIYGLELQSDGKILFDSSISFQRLLPQGAVDIGFRGPGVTNLVDPPRAMALQNDGKFIVGGSKRGTNAACLFRFHADGTVDTSFNPGPTGARITAILIAPDGKVIIAGVFTNIQGNIRNGVARLAKDGTLDGAFDAGLGVVVGTNAIVRKILRTPAGQAIVAGAFAKFNDYDRPGVTRLLADPASPPAIVTPPVPQSVHVGQFARFSAGVAAMPPGSAEWLFNGVPIEGAMNLALRIENVQPIHGGSYALTVSNSLGAVTSAPVSLTVTPAPVGPGAVDIAFEPGAGPNGTVLAAVRQPDGKTIIGGTFTKVDGVLRNRLARLHADGRLDLSFAASLNITNAVNGPIPVVRALALQPDGRIVVGGALGYVDGHLRPSIARVNMDGSVDPSFPDRLTGSEVYTLFQQRDGKIVVGGRGFYTLGRLHADGTVDVTFVRQGVGFGTRRIEAITELPDGKFLVASTDPLDPAVFGLTRLQTNGLQDATFQHVRSPVRSFVLMENSILIGGAFTNIHGVPRRYLAALNLDGALLSNAWSSVTLSDPVERIARDVCGRVLVSGSFATVNDQRHVGLARFFEDGTLDASFAPEFDGEINVLLPQSDFGLLAAGEFTEISGVLRRGVARVLDDAPSLPAVLQQSTNQVVRAGDHLTVVAAMDCALRNAFQWQLNGVNLPGATNATLDYPDAKTNLAGSFRLIVSNIVGVSTSGVVQVTVSPPTTMPGNNDVDFFPAYTPTNGVRLVAVQPDGKVLVAGKYADSRVLKRLNADGTLETGFNLVWQLAWLTEPLPRLLAIDSGGSILISVDMDPRVIFRFNSNGVRVSAGSLSTDGIIHALIGQPDGTILVGGEFDVLNQQYRAPGLVRLTSAGVVDTNFAAMLPSNLRVVTMAIGPKGEIIAARRSDSQMRIDRFEASGVLDSVFASPLLSNSISAVAVQSDGKILVAGNFTHYADTIRHHLIRLGTNGAVDATFNTALGQGDPISALALQPDDKIIVATTNTSGATLLQRGLARLQRNGAVDAAFEVGGGLDGPVTTLALTPEGNAYVGGQFRSYDDFARAFVARAHGDPEVVGAAVSGATFSIFIYTDLGRTYHLEAKDALEVGPWIIIQTVNGSGSTQTLRDNSLSAGARFYRIRIE
jgi:uncharacterized delta-60 repeat protein